MTEWLITHTVIKATEKKIICFIHKKIFINYKASWEILLNNDINLISAAIKHYVSQLNA